MKVFCPKCRGELTSDRINVATDVAHCQICHEIFALSNLLACGQAVDESFDISRVPKGVWFQETWDGWRLGATTRSWLPFFLVPFMCFWSGIALGGIYGGQILKGEFDLFASLFGIPFFLGTLVLGAVNLMAICGKVEIRVANDQGAIFVGIGRVGWTRCFDWQAVNGIEEAVLSYGRRGHTNWGLRLIGPEPLEFGSEWTDERRQYVAGALRHLLHARLGKPPAK